MNYEFIVPIVFLVVLASIIIYSMFWIGKQAEIDVKKIKEA